jgi:aminoglycoside/choline kinase family phosphotransferase
MSDRHSTISNFLQTAGWGDASRVPMPGDASARAYIRLRRRESGDVAVLMDAPPASGEDVRPFVRVARHLKSLDLSAPDILAEDPENGLLLLEDFGDALFATALSKTPELEPTFYAAAADLLARLQRAPPPIWLASHTPAQMAALTDPVFDWYLHAFDHRQRVAIRTDVQQKLETALRQIEPAAPVIVLRDFHAENLIWLPERTGVREVGLLDFQDALAGHPAYDLVSLLQDARRDVDPNLARGLVKKFSAAIGAEAAEFGRAYAILGVQRNLRILGFFARLSAHFGKPRYRDLIPRVWQHLVDSLTHPDMAELRRAVLDQFPPPDPAFLNTLRSKCPTPQKR